ncbi:helix-turn-helix domain-containing protein, partial [Rhabdochromatium marinum]|uniref:helix-turn-helix domain-containing protein n=1 Tax=Rhabdochromatium marinum TaxID=48729 RepID=UPI001908E81D
MSPVDILQWLRELLACPNLTPAEAKIGHAIALRINSRSSTCWPSLDTLARDAALSVSVAARAVAKLARLGLILIQRTGRSSVYRLRCKATTPTAPKPPKPFPPI